MMDEFTESKATDYNKIVKEIFFPIFPLLADDFLQKSRIEEGICLDIGSGNGYLGLALAEKSALKVTLIDIDPEIMELAEKNIRERQLSDRIKTLLANVVELPLQDNYAQLVVSRGSIFFWEDQTKGLNEVYRVLAPGGMAFIGGGFATPELMKAVGKKMKEKNLDWDSHIAGRIGPDAPKKFRDVLSRTNIPESRFEVSYDSVNLWIVIRK
ncbi:MAG: class I SAM-dependent methyltransferase [Eubacteriales bacterium]